MAGFFTTNPKNGVNIKHYEYADEEWTQNAVAASTAAFREWSKKPLDYRLQIIRSVARELLAKKNHLATLASEEMGKPITQAEAEIEKCAAACNYYAEHAAEMLADAAVPTEHAKSYVACCSLGPILAVMPWNYPYWQVIRCAVPALCAGNTILLKHADISTGSALALEQILLASGAPEHIFKTLVISHKTTEGVVSDPRVRAVSLTGSERAGQAVAALAGKHLKKTVLELGGSDPYIVLRDADISLAVDLCCKARFVNSGQSCIAAKRFIIEAPVYDAFVAAFVTKTEALHMGDPLERRTDIGPLCKHSAVDTAAEQVQRSVDQGAQIILGGRRGQGAGYYYHPTVLGEVTPEMAVFSEEVFAPVAPMIRARSETEAVALANHSSFGLGGAIFSRDQDRVEQVARDLINAGTVAVNAMVVSDPRLPFGGVGKSGYGRELSAFGLREFVNIKTVVVR